MSAEAESVTAQAARQSRPKDRSWPAALWVLVLYSNVPSYLAEIVLPLIQVRDWIVLLTVVTTVALTMSGRPVRGPPWAFVAVVTAYACLCLAWYVAGGGGDPFIVRQRLLGLAICVISCWAFSSSDGALLAARRALVLVVLLSVAVNAWDITHPFAMVPSYADFASVGRAAGFYMNPNQAGAALVIGFALSVGVVPERWRSVYVVAAAAGVAMTVSRAAILGFVLVCIALTFGKGALSGRRLAAAALLSGLVGWFVWMFVSAELQAQFQIDPAVVVDRVLWILDPEGRADSSQQERLRLAELAWQQFVASPVVGNGVGSTELWELNLAPHNMYVMLASDFGVIGLAVLPLVVLVAINPFRRRWTDAAVAGLFLLFWGLFSHNVLAEYYLLIGLAIIAAAGKPGIDANSPADERRPAA